MKKIIKTGQYGQEIEDFSCCACGCEFVSNEYSIGYRTEDECHYIHDCCPCCGAYVESEFIMLRE